MFHRLIRIMDLYDGLRLPVSVGRRELLLIHEDGRTWLMQRRWICCNAGPDHCNCTLVGNKVGK